MSLVAVEWVSHGNHKHTLSIDHIMWAPRSSSAQATIPDSESLQELGSPEDWVDWEGWLGKRDLRETLGGMIENIRK